MAFEICVPIPCLLLEVESLMLQSEYSREPVKNNGSLILVSSSRIAFLSFSSSPPSSIIISLLLGSFCTGGPLPMSAMIKLFLV